MFIIKPPDPSWENNTMNITLIRQQAYQVENFGQRVFFDVSESGTLCNPSPTQDPIHCIKIEIPHVAQLYFRRESQKHSPRQTMWHFDDKDIDRMKIINLKNLSTEIAAHVENLQTEIKEAIRKIKDEWQQDHTSMLERFKRCVALCYAANGEKEGLVVGKLDANVRTYLDDMDDGAKAAVIFFHELRPLQL